MTDDEVVARLLVVQRKAYDLIESINLLIFDLQDRVDNFNEDGIE